MCGICGIVFIDRREIQIEQLLTMRDSMLARGPDDAGIYHHPGIGMAARRLAVLDLSERGHMPMCTPDQRYWITYNGEIYNFKELRATLQAKGIPFHSESDTELVLNLYALEGPAMLDRLNGIFAIAIWDNQERRLFLARDRLGVKPLYYAWQDGGLYFASEEKALFAAGINKIFDPSCWEELLLFRFVSGENTPFLQVKRLLPGHYLLWKEGAIDIKRWWRLDERAHTLRKNLPEDALSWYRQIFDNAVDMERISDVPLGVLLSGGIDSSTIAASLSLLAGKGISSFTVRFDKDGYDEGDLAQEVAHKWGCEFNSRMLSDADVVAYLKKSLFFNDEPLAHGNESHLLAIAELAKQKVTVLLSGEGADETLGGYVRYSPLLHSRLITIGKDILPIFKPILGGNRRLHKLAHFLKFGSINDFVFYNACDVLPDELALIGIHNEYNFPFRYQIMEEARSLYPNEPVRQAMYIDQHTFLCSSLDRNDRMTMGASIECRVPFLDHRFVETLAALPTQVFFHQGKRKWLLRQSFRDRLPENVLNHRKWGFGVPWAYYFRCIPELRNIMMSLSDIEIIRNGPMNRSEVEALTSQFLNGNMQHQGLIMQLVMVAVWYENYF